MGFDDWCLRGELEWDEDPDWAEGQKEVELAFDILVHTTKKAYLLQFDEKNVWFPKSIATINMSMHKNTVQVPMWFVDQANLEDYITDKPMEKTETEELFNKVMRKNIKKLEDDIPF